MALPAYSPVQLDNLREITDGDPDLERQVFSLFLQTADRCLARLEGIAREKDAAVWDSTLHEIRGAAANIGAGGMAAMCMEGYGLATEDRRHELLARLGDEYALVRQFLQKERP